ncbi:MAG: DUF4954 family protein [Cytophagales bacterium]|nr:DUF4954 family protein [Cytophagales bacterium]
MKQRNLTPAEIYQLEQQGCTADNWMNILVKESFRPACIWHSSFEGNIALGDFGSPDHPEQKRGFGIFHSRIIHCDIGDQVRIDRVNRLENYSIGKECDLEDIGSLTVEGESAFGNGSEVEALNEAGGRSLPIYDRLSAQIAWLLVMCRHDKPMIAQLNRLIDTYVNTRKNTIGRIGQGTIVRHCKKIQNVVIGENAQISGAQILQEGTILSSPLAPSFIGDAVIAKTFIIQEGSSVSGGAILDKCFVGQAVKIGKQFSAENSVFFSNSECFHGEACSVFGGPYTVTHHKSSLLIAGQYSFFNAGSGTNQSNHMYKLGPMHQGMVERGSKTGSFSYMLWPSKVGPYSVVMGKHTTSFDAGDFPFSYITEEHGKTILTPAMNLFTVGTKRDIQKWPARDKRKSEEKYDFIIFDLYAPYIIQKIIHAIDLLESAYENTSKDQELVLMKGLNIHRLMLKTGRKYYELALQVFLGEGLMMMLNKLEGPNLLEELRDSAGSHANTTKEDWLDISGLFVPVSQLNQLLIEIKRGAIKSPEQIQDFFNLQFNQYPNFKISYFVRTLKDRREIILSEITAEQVEQIMLDWKKALLKLNHMILKDAEKEFDATSRMGYGITSDGATQQADFENVHGKFDENGFVIGLKNEIQMVEQKASEILSKLVLR